MWVLQSDIYTIQKKGAGIKSKLYTRSHDVDLLRSIDNGGRQFTAEEHAYVIEQASAASFVSQRELVRRYLTENHAKLAALDFAMEVASDNGATRLLSLGAGQCVLEWLLQMALPETGFVVATDFDPYFVRKADELFPELRTTTFDFFNDEVSELVAQIGAPVDLAVFFGSAYVMDDATFVELFWSASQGWYSSHYRLPCWRDQPASAGQTGSR